MIGTIILTATTAIAISKSSIDTWFTDNYDWLNKIAKSHIYINKREIEPAELLSNAYIYAIKKRTQIPDSKTLEIFMSRFITTQSLWTNSETNKQTVGQSNEPDYFDIIEEEDDLEEKIEFELWYTSCKSTLAQYRQTIKQKHKQIFFDVYFGWAEEGKKISVRKLASHFKISNTSTHNMIVEMREDIQRYISANNLHITDN